MKNLMGLLPRNSTFRVHMYGLEGSIVDLNAARPSDLVITDAIYTLMGNFPSQGDPIYTGFITVADNVVAADLVAARALQRGPSGDRISWPKPHERGLGPSSLAEVDLLGDNLDEILAGSRCEPAPSEHELAPLADRFTIYADDACASCRQALAAGLIAAMDYAPDLVESLSPLTGRLRAAEERPQDRGRKRPLLWQLRLWLSQRGHANPWLSTAIGYVLSGLRQMARLHPRYSSTPSPGANRPSRRSSPSSPRRGMRASRSGGRTSSVSWKRVGRSLA